MRESRSLSFRESLFFPPFESLKRSVPLVSRVNPDHVGLLYTENINTDAAGQTDAFTAEPGRHQCDTDNTEELMNK